jgi:hypothetical protein
MRALGFDVKKPDIIKMVHGALVAIATSQLFCSK